MKFTLRCLFLFIICLLPIQTFASTIKDIDIVVELDSAGGASVWETWSVDVSDDNSEWYLARGNYGNMVISDFSVYDEDAKKDFTFVDGWNVDWSRAEKANKCGEVAKEGNDKELCWGVGSSGPHRWTAYYYVSGFVKQYNDACGFNHTFITHDMSSGVDHARLTILRADSVPFSKANARIWAFNFKGSINFSDSCIVAESKEPLTTDNAMTVMCIFPKGDFVSSNIVRDTIGTMKWKALDGSDYVNGDNDDEETTWDVIVCVIIFLAIFGFIYFLGLKIMVFLFYIIFFYGVIILWNIVSLRPLRKWYKRRKLLKGHQDAIYTTAPLDGNLHRTFSILKDCAIFSSPSNNNLISAYMVRLMEKGALAVESSTNEKGKLVTSFRVVEGFYGMHSNQNADTLGYDTAELEGKNASSMNVDAKIEELLYRIVYMASGNDLILQQDELKTWSVLNRNHDMLVYLKNLIELPEAEPTADEYQQIVGQQDYFKHLSDASIQHLNDTSVWDENMVFATLFGTEKKLLKSLDLLYPDYFTKSVMAKKNDLHSFNCGFYSYSFYDISDEITDLSGTSDSSSDGFDGFGGDSSSDGGSDSSGDCGGGGGR